MKHCFNNVKVCEILCSKNWSMTTLANKMDIYPTHVYKWMNGENEPSLYYAALMARVLDVDINELIKEEE